VKLRTRIVLIQISLAMLAQMGLIQAATPLHFNQGKKASQVRNPPSLMNK
jgi:hypothetical protein